MSEFFGIPASPYAINLGVSESAILRTLVLARKLVAAGWCQRLLWCDALGNESGEPRHHSLLGALKTAGGGELVGHYSIQFVARTLRLFDLSKWNDHPLRTKAEVLEALNRCVIAAGGAPARKGGWRMVLAPGAA